MRTITRGRLSPQRSSKSPLHPLLYWGRLYYYRAALRNMQRTKPTHPDVNYLVPKIHHLESQQ